MVCDTFLVSPKEVLLFTESSKHERWETVFIIASFSSLSSASIRKNELPDDDLCVSSDGAMCSKSSQSKTGMIVCLCGPSRRIDLSSIIHCIVLALVGNVASDLQDGSSSSSNDDDGGMHHTKTKKREKRTEGSDYTAETCGMSIAILGAEKFSSARFIDRHSVRRARWSSFWLISSWFQVELLLCLYEASLYKITCVYNRMMKTTEPQYEYANLLTTTYNEKVRTRRLSYLIIARFSRPSRETQLHCSACHFNRRHVHRRQLRRRRKFSSTLCPCLLHRGWLLNR